MKGLESRYYGTECGRSKIPVKFLGVYIPQGTSVVEKNLGVILLGAVVAAAAIVNMTSTRTCASTIMSIILPVTSHAHTVHAAVCSTVSLER